MTCTSGFVGGLGGEPPRSTRPRFPRSLMFEAAAMVGLDPDGLSFTGCFQILNCRLPECDGKTAASFEAWYEGLLRELQGERTEPRRNRINPRVIKRKMSKGKEETSRASAPSAFEENVC